MSWTVEQVLALAPDASSAKSGLELAAPRKWVSLGCGQDTLSLWGECKGSGAQPYRTSVDLSGPAFKCSCPSRKFPCKHGLGLFLVYATARDSFPAAEAPGWHAEWLESRRARAEQGATPNETPAPARATAEQQKRAKRREARVEAGVEELERWLHDVVRPGLAELPARPRASFEQMAARLTDAQAPGLARLVRDLADLPHSSGRWPERMLLELGRLELLLEAFRRQDRLDDGLRAEVRSLVGFAESREHVLATSPVHDVWSVLGHRVEVEERLSVQRTWLWGEQTQRWALLIDFAAPGQTIEKVLVPGTRAEGSLCFYPGALPLRALPREPLVTLGQIGGVPASAVEPALRGYAQALARNPWIERFPLAIGPVVPAGAPPGTWSAVDDERRRLPLGGSAGWHLLALSGGHALDLFGEWDGHRLWPLAAYAGGAFVHLPMQSAGAETRS